MGKVLSAIALFLGFLFCLVLYVVVTTPNPNDILGCIKTKMYNVDLCTTSSSYVRAKNISQTLKSVIVVSEDSAFYGHKGFDWHELKKSFETNLHSRRFARGGSTITQQLVKNVFLTGEKSLFRKVREAILARQIENLLTKDQILEKYLNVIEFGPGLFGIKAAAQHYFGKSPSELNLLESSYLAYLLPNPKSYSKTFRDRKLTKFSRFRILDLCYKMYRFRKISLEEYELAKSLVDQFPWVGLNLDQPAIASDTPLEGIESPTDNLDVDIQPDPEIPEFDESVSVEQEDPAPEDQPFEE